MHGRIAGVIQPQLTTRCGLACSEKLTFSEKRRVTVRDLHSSTLSTQSSPLLNRYAAGTATRESKGAVTIPPTIGAAILALLAPVPLDIHDPGMRPAGSLYHLVMALGRTRSTAPSISAACNCSAVSLPSCVSRFAMACLRYSSMMTPNSAAPLGQRNESDS